MESVSIAASVCGRWRDVLVQLIRSDRWIHLTTLDHRCRVERAREYCLCVVYVNKWGAVMPCWLHCHETFVSKGGLTERKLTFVPLGGQTFSAADCERVNLALGIL